MNSIQLIGRLVADPQGRDAKRPVTRFRVAVDRVGSDGPDVVPVVTFDRLATVSAQHLSKGRLVAVSGRLNTSRWTDADGNPRSMLEVIAASVTFLDRPATGRNNGSAPAATVEVQADDGVELSAVEREQHLAVVG
jgi:single-strand DNA-binding protein